LTLAFLALPAGAVEWKFSPSVSGQATYTDNYRQAHDNTQDALILSVTPGFSLQSQGSRRIQAAVTYGLSGIARFADDDSTDVNHHLAANAKAELVNDFLFFDATAGVTQELISLTGSPADATVNNANRATVGTYSLSPYVRHRFGTFANAEARYTLSGALFQNNAANDVTSNQLQASLTSGTQFNDLSWGLDYSYRDATVQGGADATFEHYGARAGYALTRHVRVFGTLGYDNNDYATQGARVSGRSWSLGVGWAPTRRTHIDVSAGRSYFGRTYGLDFTHRTARTVWTANYSEGATDISQQLLSNQPLVAWQCAGGLFFNQGLLPPTGQTDCVSLGTAPAGSVPIGLANGISITKTLRGAASWSHGRSSLGLNVFDTRRQFQQLVGLPEDETRGVSATAGYRLAPHTTLNLGLAYTNNQVPAALNTAGGRNDDLYTASAGATHQFDRRLSGALTLRHQQRNSNDNLNDFKENSITASAALHF